MSVSTDPSRSKDQPYRPPFLLLTTEECPSRPDPSALDEVILTADGSPDAELAREQVQYFLQGQNQQGHTYVPGKQANQSRAKTVKKAIQGVEEHLPNPASAYGKAQGGQSHTSSNVTTTTAGHQYMYQDRKAADVYGVG